MHNSNGVLFKRLAFIYINILTTIVHTLGECRQPFVTHTHTRARRYHATASIQQMPEEIKHASVMSV